MSRTPNQFETEHEDGSCTLRSTIPPTLWAIAKQFAKRWRVDNKQGLEIMLDLLDDELEQTSGESFGSIFQKAYGELLAADKAPHDRLPMIDIGRLHRSPRKNSASGYVGVYPNGKNFRAMARNPTPGGPQVNIGTFPTPERAAWARLLFYKKHQLAYGELEDFLQKDEAELYRVTLRNRDGREPSDAEIISEVNQDRREHPDPNFPEIEWDGPLPAPTITPPWQQPPPAPRDPNFVPRLPTREEMREDAKQAKLDNRPRVADPIPPLKYTSPEIEALLDAPEVPRSNGKAR